MIVHHHCGFLLSLFYSLLFFNRNALFVKEKEKFTASIDVNGTTYSKANKGSIS